MIAATQEAAGTPRPAAFFSENPGFSGLAAVAGSLAALAR
jgi:hypothetical protein